MYGKFSPYPYKNVQNFPFRHRSFHHLLINTNNDCYVIPGILIAMLYNKPINERELPPIASTIRFSLVALFHFHHN
jgi:hypothetical protein